MTCWKPLLSFSEWLSSRCCYGGQLVIIGVWKLVGLLVSVSDPLVRPVAFSVVVVERNGMVCDCRLVFLCCCRFTGASCVSPHATFVSFTVIFCSCTQKLCLFLQCRFCRSFCILLSALDLLMHEQTSYRPEWFRRSNRQQRLLKTTNILK